MKIHHTKKPNFQDCSCVCTTWNLSLVAIEVMFGRRTCADFSGRIHDTHSISSLEG